MKHGLLAPAAALVVAHSAFAQSESAGRVPVVDVRVLMIAAIDSRDGTARGILAGKDADNITKLFNGTGPILIDVTTVRRFAQVGCSRLRVAFAQDGVVIAPQAAPRRQWAAFGINYCRDGQPPKSGS